MEGDGAGLERLLTPRFHALLETLLQEHLPQAPRLLAEYAKGGFGRPDLAFAREGQPARAFIELKQPATRLDRRGLRGHDADQYDRFARLPLWALCNFQAIRLNRREELIEEAVILPANCLDPATSDTAAERAIRRHDPAAFLRILEALALAPPVAPRSPEQAAEVLAHAARLVKDIVLAQCRAGAPEALRLVQDEFRDTLFAHAAVGGYDERDENALFAAAFAQTLAFGLLLAREASATRPNRNRRTRQEELLLPQDVDCDAYRLLPDESYPLLRATLRALTQDEILDLLGIAFDVIQDTVNAIDIALLAPRGGNDPILYFYEFFLATFDPAARRRHGVFFTPVPVVRFMVAATDRALREHLKPQGLLDPDVRLLDPACGTGTFLIAAVDAVAERARATWGEGHVSAELAALAKRLYGFELLVGPYTVAHYRLLRATNPGGGAPSSRMNIYLADTLAPPAGAVGITSHLGFMSAPIVQERQEADRLKRETPILAIFGNPPYRRLNAGEEAAITGGWDNGFWEDLKRPVRNAGWGGELNTFPDLYIAFWRWCIWKLFESEGAPGRGVVCLITNRTFLAGHPYAGLRQMLRRRFDFIDIVDLRGDSRGARPAGIEADENVFAIQAGVCILTAVATGDPRAADAEARVRYADVWRRGAFTAAEKCAILQQTSQASEEIGFIEAKRGVLADFTAGAFEGLDWPNLTEAFAFCKSGSKSQRDELVYGFTQGNVLERIRAFLVLPEAEAERIFFPGKADEGEVSDSNRANDGNSTPTGARRNSEATRLSRARREGIQSSHVEFRVYRPLDRRYLYASRNFVSRFGPELVSAWGDSNRCIYALPAGTGAGPAVWVHGLLPDYHAFRGSYGGYAFPLWDRRKGADAYNLDPALLRGLVGAYGPAATPENVFDAIIALLSATSYTRRFAWDLEESFAHVPFPADAETFTEAVRIGAEIRAVETFARDPALQFRSARVIGRPSGVTLAVLPIGRAFHEDGSGNGSVALQEDQSLRLTNVPQPVWEFAVSGYRVLPRWLLARNGEALDAALLRAIADIAWRIEELLHWFDEADAVLNRALAHPLTRAALGLAVEKPAAAGVGLQHGLFAATD